MSNVIEEVKKISTELNEAWEAFKTEHALSEEEKAKLGEERAETKQTIEKIDERLDALEVEWKKAALDTDKPKDGEPSLERKAYETFLRKGARAVGENLAKLVRTDGEGNILESKAMEVSDDTEGGFGAPEDVLEGIIKGVVEFSPMRSICRVRPTIRISVKATKRTQTTSAVWVGEVDTRAETQNPKYGKEEINTRELSAMADISRQDLEDTGFDLEDELYADFSEQFGVAEAVAFVSGDGVDGKPEGFLTAADTGYLGANGIETITSVTNDVLEADDFINVYFALKDVYAKNANWVLRRSSIRDARKLKDLNDQYLWQPGLAGLAPATILEQPYVEAKDMPAVANGALSIAFGDFRRGYLIVDRLMIETLRDPYTQAGNGYIRFWARKRVGGQVLLPEAIKLLEIQ